MRMSAGRIWLVCAAMLYLLLLPACRRDSGSPFEGSYRTISESEWNIILMLKKGGIAEIRVETWAPGEYKRRSTDKTEGDWSFDGNIVTVEYNGIKDRLAYDPELSLASIGYKGGAPGLQQTGTFAEDSILQDYPLWKLPHKFGESSQPR